MGENFGSAELGVDVVAYDDTVDCVESVFEVCKCEEKCLCFEDESLDFFFYKAGVPDVMVQDDPFSESYGLKGREEFIVQKGGDTPTGGVGDGDAVKEAFSPTGGGEDIIDAATNMRVEAL